MTDAGDMDALNDAGPAADSGPNMTDGGQQDGDAPLPGFGEISGDCQELDTEITDSDSSIHENRIDFAVSFIEDEHSLDLTDGAQAIVEAGNAGGSSLYSEAFAFEILARCESAILLETETSVDYEADYEGPITDLVVDIDGERIGVSVTRALYFPFDEPYPIEEAERLLNDKLADITQSSAGVTVEDEWRKQILHILAYSEDHAEKLRTAYEGVAENVRADTIVYVTATNGLDDFLY